MWQRVSAQYTGARIETEHVVSAQYTGAGIKMERVALAYIYFSWRISGEMIKNWPKLGNTQTMRKIEVRHDQNMRQHISGACTIHTPAGYTRTCVDHYLQPSLSPNVTNTKQIYFMTLAINMLPTLWYIFPP